MGKLKLTPTTSNPEIFEGRTNVKLISIGDKFQENVNGTRYVVATVKMDTGKQVTAMVFENNLKYGVEVGQEYSAKVIYDPTRGGELLITMSHLPAGERANIEDFDFEIMPAKSELSEAKAEIADALKTL
jgi:hypothetical protein